MSQSAYIKLVTGSERDSITLEEVKELLQTYIEQTSKTGQQLDWGVRESRLSLYDRDQTGIRRSVVLSERQSTEL